MKRPHKREVRTSQQHTIASPLTVECVGDATSAFTSTSNLTIPFSSAFLYSADLACDALDVPQPVRMMHFIPQVSGMWSFMVDNDNNTDDLVMEIRLACSNQVLGCNDDLEYNSIKRTGLLQVELRSHVEYAILLGTWQLIPTQLEQYVLQVSYYVDEDSATDSILIIIITATVVAAFVICCIVFIVQQRRSRVTGGEIEQAMIPTMRSPKDLESNPVFFAERRQHHIRAASPKAAISPRIV